MTREEKLKLREDIKNAEKPFLDFIDDSVEPIFVRGISRSGGSLTATILDAHPDISMSYEIYPRLLGRKLETNRSL